MAGEQRDPLNHFLDDALATYANQDPRPGLERRVLNLIRADGGSAWFPLLRWALPITALGCLLAGIALWNHGAPPPAPPDIVRTEASPLPAIAAITEPARRLPGHPRDTRHAMVPNARHANVPKQAEFPIRALLTHQERALVAFVRSTPDEALQAFGETRRMKIEPLRIDGIQLQPLQISGGAK